MINNCSTLMYMYTAKRPCSYISIRYTQAGVGAWVGARGDPDIYGTLGLLFNTKAAASHAMNFSRSSGALIDFTADPLTGEYQTMDHADTWSSAR